MFKAKKKYDQPIKLNLSVWHHPVTNDKITMDIVEECISDRGLRYDYYDLDRFAARLKADGWVMISPGKIPEMRELPRRQFSKPFKKGQLFQLATNQLTIFSTTKYEDSYNLKNSSKEDKTSEKTRSKGLVFYFNSSETIQPIPNLVITKLLKPLTAESSMRFSSITISF